ncbi:MAG: hypothetical protein CVT64_05535 [Actinobacteria bacterium HGW-Actinobacteria-4]|nr:MAG: hypothetical protein CVT64_05535 [Actinobacteria bacterium HGW-Actinobacteria-4]
MTSAIDSLPRVVERVLGEGRALYAAARARSAALAELDHPAVVAPLRILAKDGGVVVAHVPRIDGVDVATLLASRGSLSAGECVTLGTAVAEALAAMHSAGLTHGDLSSANVMVSDGRVVLVDTIAGAQPEELGTAPYSAPERALGATPAGDMYSLGMLLRECAAGADRAVIDAWTDPLIDPNPAARPAASMVARALASCATPQPIDSPATDIAHAMRARAQAHRDRTVRLPQGRAWRIRKATTNGVVIGAVLLAMLASAAVVISRFAAVADAPVQVHVDPVVPIPAYAAVTPQEAGRVLTEMRFAALAGGDGDGLLATTTPTGTARAVVASQSEALSAGALVFEGLTVRVAEAVVLSTSGNVASVEVSYVVSAHRAVVEGVTTEVAAYEQEAILELRWLAGQGWLVDHARPRS